MTSNTVNAQQVTQEEVYRESLKLSQSSPGVIPFMEDEIVRLEAESAKFL